MPPFTVNPHRFDPYKNFKFRVVIAGRAVAGVTRISPLRRVTEVIAHREGMDFSTPRFGPGLTTFDPIVLERGVSHDQDFERWANEVFSPDRGRGNETALASFRRDVRIELYNEAGQLVIAYLVRRAWVSEYVALSALDAATSEIAFQSITLQHEGWERDASVVEPVEPSTPTPPSPAPSPSPAPPSKEGGANGGTGNGNDTDGTTDTDADGVEDHPVPPPAPTLPPRLAIVPNRRTAGTGAATTPTRSPSAAAKTKKANKVVKKKTPVKKPKK